MQKTWRVWPWKPWVNRGWWHAARRALERWIVQWMPLNVGLPALVVGVWVLADVAGTPQLWGMGHRLLWILEALAVLSIWAQSLWHRQRAVNDTRPWYRWLFRGTGLIVPAAILLGTIRAVFH